MEQIKEYLLNNMDELQMVVSELNSWNGCLEQLDFWENDEDFFNTFFSQNPTEAVRASYYGKYEFMDEYVRFDGYGNLESFTEYTRNSELKAYIDDIVEELLTNYSHIAVNEELADLIAEEAE